MTADGIAAMPLDELRRAVERLTGFTALYWWQVFERLEGWSLMREATLTWRVWRIDENGEEHIIAQSIKPEVAILRAYLMVRCYLPPNYGGVPVPPANKEGDSGVTGDPGTPGRPS